MIDKINAIKNSLILKIKINTYLKIAILKSIQERQSYHNNPLLLLWLKMVCHLKGIPKIKLINEFFIKSF